MAQQLLEVQQLAGQARNPVLGQVQDEVVRPTRIFNLFPDRAGGYTPFGYRNRLLGPTIDGTPVTLQGQLIGFDELGISSWLYEDEVWNGSAWVEVDKLRLFRGRQTYDQQHAPHDSKWLDAGLTGPLVHLEGAGAYADRSAYMVFDRERRPMEPVTSTVRVDGNPGSPLETSTTPATFLDVAFGGTDIAMAVSSRAIWRREGAGSWEQVYLESDALRGDFRRIAYGGGAWLAPQARTVSGGGYPFTVMRTDDDGDNWTQIDPYTSGGDPIDSSYRFDPYSVAYSGGKWNVGGRVLWANESDGGSGLAGSQDGGVTWKASGTMNLTRGHLRDLAASPDSSFWATADYVPTQRADPWVSFDGLEWGVYHTPPGMPGWAGGKDDYRIYPFAQRIIWLGGDGKQFLVIHQSGRVSRGTLIYPGLAWPGSEKMVQYTSMIEGGGEMMVYDADIDRETNTIIAVGQFTPSGEPAEPRVWASTDSGASWNRLTEVEDAIVAGGSSTVRVVAIDPGGRAWYYGGTVEVNAGSRVGLASGSYNIYAVSYFNTQAGRFVYDLSRTTITSQDGGYITFAASGKAQILADNPWMTSEMVDDLRFDVYIQLQAEAIDLDGSAGGAGPNIVTPENTIRYAFTEPFPAGSGEQSIDRQLAALPLGRQLIVGGQATTAVFEKSQTALHNGRVWGMLNQEEDLWHVDADKISPELANQHSKFVLGYTETNWANLMGDRNFIPLTPTQSQNFTGLISTPTGLLVVFDNEVLLVTGDPAFPDSVTVETYLDMGGGDVGAKPTKVGGVPFTIWNGKVWALQQGQLAEVASDQYLDDDRFVRIAPEPQSLSLLALTAGGAVFRLILDKQFWFTDPVTRHTSDESGVVTENFIGEMLPNCVCESGDNTRFVAQSGEVWTTRRDPEVPPDAPHVLWWNMDFGEPERRKGLYLVKAVFEGDVMVSPNYNRFDPGFDPDAVPGLIYEAAHGGNGVAWGSESNVDPQLGGIPPVLAAPVSSRRVGGLSWRFPLGRKSRTWDVRLELRGMSQGDVVKLPIRFYYSVQGAVR